MLLPAEILDRLLEVVHSSVLKLVVRHEGGVVLVVSHGGVRGTCDNARNLSDDQVLGIARTGGVIGIERAGKMDTAFGGRAFAGDDAVALAFGHQIESGSVFMNAPDPTFTSSTIAFAPAAIFFDMMLAAMSET